MKSLRCWIGLVACLIAAGLLSVPAARSADDYVYKIGQSGADYDDPGGFLVRSDTIEPLCHGQAGRRGHITLNGNAKEYYLIWGADWGNPYAKTLDTHVELPGPLGRGGRQGRSGDRHATISCAYVVGALAVGDDDLAVLLLRLLEGQGRRQGLLHRRGRAASVQGSVHLHARRLQACPRVDLGDSSKGEWTVTDGGKAVVAFLIKMSTVRDQVRFELTITNKTGAAANIGLQMVNDAEVSQTLRLAIHTFRG